jgi:serine phosphatase RsbU (regulator of sigma subunit)
VGLPAKDLNTNLLAAVEKYRERVPFPDDVTVLTCKVFG